MSKSKAIELVRAGELDKVPPGYWTAIVDGRVVAWAKSLAELREVMRKRGYGREDYVIFKVPRHDLLVL